MKIVAGLILLMGAGVAFSQTGKASEQTSAGEFIVSAPLATYGVSVSDNSTVLMKCDVVNDVPAKCVLSEGHTMDEVMAAVLKSMKSDSASWKSENDNLRARLQAVIKIATSLIQTNKKGGQYPEAKP